MILKIIKQTIAEYNLLEKGDKVLIGLSGGADSVCLTHALKSLADEIGITLYTAHLNHGIRGDEAQRDEDFAKAFSASLQITCFTEKRDIPSEARRNGVSEETAGRNARYAFFERLCEEHCINKTATAHNKNDNAETILMNFMRGSSVSGLSGIPYSRGKIIRPILNVARCDIEEYCKENHLEYVTDSTNLTQDYTRNKIRHTFIPLIQNEINTNFTATVTENARLIRDDGEYLEQTARGEYEKYVHDNSIATDALLNMNKAIGRRVVRLMLKSVYRGLNDIPSGYTEDILALAKKQSGAHIDLLGGVSAKNEYGTLIIAAHSEEAQPFCAEIEIGTEVYLQSLNKTVAVTRTDKRKNDGAIYLACGADTKYITVRSRKNGDKFKPCGMNGSKKVKQYFIDKKIPREKRNLIPVIEIGTGIAAVGDRVDSEFLFNDGGIRIEFKNKD
jgi:tRNA(Ile)-lysidine synthase